MNHYMTGICIWISIMNHNNLVKKYVRVDVENNLIINAI